jgi:ferrochelatase
MSTGSPDRVEDVEPFIRRILARRPPSPEVVKEFQDRYRQIGGRSPLLEISRAQARALEASLKMPVYVGMRFWTPLIREAVDQARKDGIERLVGVGLAPHYSPISVGAYLAELRSTGIPCVPVRQWHQEPAFLAYWKRAVADLEFVLFTAHSIPVEGAEPYPTQVAETVRAVASGPHTLAWQSKSPSPEPWLGPGIGDVLGTLKGRVSVAPIGFVSEHLEILYDLDILYRRRAEDLGLAWERLPMPNDHPMLIEALDSAVRKHL